MLGRHELVIRAKVHPIIVTAHFNNNIDRIGAAMCALSEGAICGKRARTPKVVAIVFITFS
jgi:hypothetical protein